MPEYSLEFSEVLLKAAQYVADNDGDEFERMRTVLYLSSLASEITLKALLEKAGKPIESIKGRGHSLCNLLIDLHECEVMAEVTKGQLSWVSAVRVRAVTVDDRHRDATIGKLLTGEEHEASKYPNELRYGDHVKDYPPELKLKAARALLVWARKNWEDIRLTPGTP